MDIDERQEPEQPPVDEPAPARSGRRGKGYFLPGIIALAALLGLGLFVGAGDLEHPAATTLDGTVVSSQISLAIEAEQNRTTPPQVTCPAKEPVRAGWAFDCSLSGHPDRPVHVTEVDSRGRIRFALGQ